MLANIKCLFSNTFKFQDIKNVLERTCPDDSGFVTFLCIPFYPKITIILITSIMLLLYKKTKTKKTTNNNKINSYKL